ncbi:MAG: Glycerol kinase [Candidatus Accumulibacter sp. BA-94]|nr:MAG: Glycerol kinase [Candidatus Accumulibacter sp. BA-94]
MSQVRTSQQLILALDQGTTSSRAILFTRNGTIHGVAQQEYPQHYPQPGWVEHDANDIWRTQLAVARRVLREHGVVASQIAAVGITNQRETTVLWDRASGEPLHGEPLHRAIVWQDRRTAGLCDSLRAAGHAETFRERTGLVVDAYFSGTKLKWLLDNIPGARARAERGACRARRACFWHDRFVAGVEAVRRPGACHRSVERLAHPALRHSPPLLG